MLYKITRVLLWLLLAFGLYGALSVSYSTITKVSPCPSVAGIYICYVVLVGYLMMVIAQFLQSYKRSIFYIGYLIVFAIALLGTGLEITQGNACPQSGSGLPLCYVSFFVSVVIGVLFWVLMRQKSSLHQRRTIDD